MHQDGQTCTLCRRLLPSLITTHQLEAYCDKPKHWKEQRADINACARGLMDLIREVLLLNDEERQADATARRLLRWLDSDEEGSSTGVHYQHHIAWRRMDTAAPSTCNGCQGDGFCSTCKGYGRTLVRRPWQLQTADDGHCPTCEGFGIIYTPSFTRGERTGAVPLPCPACSVLTDCTACNGDGVCVLCRGSGFIEA